MYNGREFKLGNQSYTIYETSKCPQTVLDKLTNVSGRTDYYMVVWSIRIQNKLTCVTYRRRELEVNIENGSWILLSNDPLVKELLKVLEVK